MANATLTPKQKQVRDLLEKSTPVPEIAKKLKISPSGVYGHKRNIEAILGTSFTEAPSNGDGPKPTRPRKPAAAKPIVPPAPPAPALSNVSDPSDPAAVLKAAIARDERREADITAEVTTLEAEQKQIVERLTKYNAALEALA